MAYKIVVLDVVFLELEDAVDWYSKISPELSKDIVEKYIDALNEVQNKPLLNPEMKGKYRKVNLKRFPYKLIYKMFPDEILIVALAAHKRKPDYWRKR